MSAEIIKLSSSRFNWRPATRVNLLPHRSGLVTPRDILAASENFVECGRAVRQLGKANNRSDIPLLKAFASRVGKAEKRLWDEIAKCDQRASGEAVRLAKQRWSALAGYLAARTIIEKMEPAANPAELFSEFSRVCEELIKCEFLWDFISYNWTKLVTGHEKIMVPIIFFLGPGDMLHGGYPRAVEEGEDALLAFVAYLNAYSSPQRYRATRHAAAKDQLFVCEITTSAHNDWGCFKLFADLVLDYFGQPVAKAGEATPPGCKRIEWVDSLARWQNQPLFFRKLPDGAEQFAVIRPSMSPTCRTWGYRDKWIGETNKLTRYIRNTGGYFLAERERPKQKIVLYYLPANPERIEPVSTGLGGDCRDLYGVPAEAIRGIASVLDKKR